jgi:hypothetical protein
LKAGSGRIAGGDTAPGKSSSMSIGDLWSEINSVRNVDAGDAPVAAACSHLETLTSCPVLGVGRVATEGSGYMRGGVTLDSGPERSPIIDRGCGTGRGRGSASPKGKATQILDDSKRGNCSDISPRTKRSFVERRYSSWTRMDRSEWKIILE